MADPRRVVIRERLYPDVHDALLEVLSKYPRQAGNQVVLAMSEACLTLWPITEADYNVSDEGESQLVKLTVSEEKYPKLFALYTALPRGVKGQAVINLLNRHQMMRHADPGKVNDALNAALLGASPKVDAEVSADVDFGAQTASQEKPVVRQGKPGEAASVDSKGPEQNNSHQVELVGGPAEEPLYKAQVDILDPLADLPPMEFD